MTNRIVKWVLGLIVLVIIVLLSINFTRQGRKEKPELRIGHISITDHLILGISQNRDGDTFENFKLKTVKFKGWSRLEKALLEGELDGAFILAPLGMKVEQDLHSRGMHTRAVLLGHRDGSALMIRVNSDIHTAADFKGKTIAIPNILSTHNVLLHKIITKAGLDYNEDIITKVMAPPDMPFALISEDIDAYIVAEPFGAQVEEYEYGKILTLSHDVWPHHICCVLLMQKNFLDKNPEAVEELLSSLVDSGEFIEKNPEEAAIIGGRFLAQSKKTIYRVLTVPEERVSYNDLMPDKKDFTNVQNYLVDVMNVADKKVDIDKWVMTEFAQKVFEKKSRE